MLTGSVRELPLTPFYAICFYFPKNRVTLAGERNDFMNFLLLIFKKISSYTVCTTNRSTEITCHSYKSYIATAFAFLCFIFNVLSQTNNQHNNQSFAGRVCLTEKALQFMVNFV